ncbi:MAG: hypothetical protein JW751_24110 [Polyangiaceae bacterium]|nr:hypothetical protein [Polyangiaceae bacterium]
MEDDDGALAVLELEMPRSAPLVTDVHQALFAIGVHISNVQVSVRGDCVVERLSVAERDGSPLAAGRHLDVQIAVMEVVQRRLVDSVRPGVIGARNAAPPFAGQAVG